MFVGYKTSEKAKRNGVRYVEEDTVIKYDVLSPLFGWISRKAWVDYKPINWYSDDIQCLEMRANGFVNYISRSYVHPVDHFLDSPRLTLLCCIY